MHPDIETYNSQLPTTDATICTLLAKTINSHLPAAESKIWHGHPVWFLEGNPVVGYSKLKTGVRLLFWSGQSFETTELKAEGKFKAASASYKDASEVDVPSLKKWLQQASTIQWDYKNIVKRKGRLERLK